MEISPLIFVHPDLARKQSQIPCSRFRHTNSSGGGAFLARQAPLPQRRAGGLWCPNTQGDRVRPNRRGVQQDAPGPSSTEAHLRPPAGVRNLTFIQHTRRAFFFVLRAHRRTRRPCARVVGGLATLFATVRSDIRVRTMVPVRL